MGAVCDVTAPGVALLLTHLGRIKRSDSFFVVGSDPPTDPIAVNDLITKSDDHVRAHTRAKFSEDLPEGAKGAKTVGLMHSKLVYAESPREATLWVGSHNLTHSGMDGVNIEAALIVTGDPSELHFTQARSHLEAIWNGASAGLIATGGLGLDNQGDIVVIDCEMTHDQIAEVQEKERYHVTVCLRHSMYDKHCIPPKEPHTLARVRAFLPGHITDEGPSQAPAAVFQAKFTGVQFTENNRNRTLGRERISETPDGTLVEVGELPVEPSKVGQREGKLARLRLVSPTSTPEDWTIGLLEVMGQVNPNEDYELDDDPRETPEHAGEAIQLPKFANVSFAREIFGEKYVNSKRTLTTGATLRQTFELRYLGSTVPPSYTRLMDKAEARHIDVRLTSIDRPYRFIRLAKLKSDKK